MLGERDAIATIPVKNMDVAKKFYESTLGLKREATEGKEALMYRSGNSKVLVYKSDHAGTNRATAASWAVDDVEREVQTLKGKGVTFEHYNFPDMKLVGDVHVAGSMKVAWLKDPDGNILSMFNA